MADNRSDFQWVNSMEKILIVEDDLAVRKALTRLFESAGYAVETSGDGKSALDLFHLAPPTAVVLDLGLPVVSGKEVCLQVKKQMCTLPVIIVTGRTDVVDKVLLLELGADDYVTKPFSPRELLARVRALIRSTHRPVVRDEIKFDGICVNVSAMEVTRDGHPVVLTAEEFKMLSFFLRNEGRDISRDEILGEALRHHDYSSPRTVDNHILKLRHKLERDPANPIHFHTAYGRGYRFVR